MATKFFLRDATTTVTGTLPTAATQSSSLTASVTATGAGTNRSMTTTAGAAQVATTLATLASTASQKNWFRRFVSPPIAAQSFASITWTFAMAGLTSSTSISPFSFEVSFYLWRPSTGARIAYLDDPLVFGATAAASETGAVQTFITGPQSAADGDVLILEVWGAVVQGMATSATWTFDYEGTTDPVNTTAISSAASYISASQDIPLYVASSFIASPNKPILQAVNRAANWCKHQRRDSGLYTSRRRVLLPTP